MKNRNATTLSINENPSKGDLFRAAKATMLFELSRSLTGGRLAAATVLALFPPLMTKMTLLTTHNIVLHDLVVVILVFLVILLSQLLWASSIVHTELEGKTWIYIASRPQGRTSTVLGKYLVAVLWGFTVAWFAMSLSLMVISDMYHPSELFYQWGVYTTLIGLACIAYGAIFVFIGVMFHHRAMVLCAGYSLLSETLLANIPALISRFTVRFHLTSLMTDLIEPSNPNPVMQALYNSQPAWLDVLLVLFITAVALTATIVTLHRREYLSANEA